ncbi:hypothetical protein CC78DRAFT_571458 [Lojkania enalia]|uniref:Phosphatidylinositol N-acetylglucosaminyltransferase subunit H conserved domain-containing protein n=1 Tax=Lojkania enalia TaxID=147567 RepID=A0A9P4N021_9PLEO|nr:hypothetical protein CC78DRAFT_571458 [Didymosphaeria enalia]
MLFSAPVPPTLTTFAPTPSTISFTVSTRPLSSTLPAKLSNRLSLVLKALLGILAIVALFTKYRLQTSKSTALLSFVLGCTLEHKLCAALRDVSWKYVLPSAVAVLYLVIHRGYTEESLLALRSLGLQTRTSSRTYLTPATTRFIPMTSIQDIFIHEAFKGFEVRFYLAVVVRGEEDVVVVFPKLMPRREVLEEVWRGARACLYEGAEEGKGG